MLGTWQNINSYLVPGEWTRSRMDGWINDKDMRSSVFSIQSYSIYILYISMSFCSIVHVLEEFNQPPKRTKTNTLRLAVQRISYLLLRKVTDRFGTQEDQFV